MNYHSINDLVELCHKNNAQIWQVIMMDNAHERMVSEDKIFENMRLMYKAMKTADNNYDKSLKSPSRMAGGDGELMYQYNKSGRNICGDFVGMVMEKALKMGESNACMRRIVAAPTAGSCGVIPAVFISYETYFKALEDDMVKALLIASGIGAVIAENTSIAGASGGCQAEIGSASAMAAAGLTFLQGGDSMQIVNSSALALKSMLGLACDPVCGLVEVPCIKRNVAGAMNAITAAQMSMAGIKSVISPDEVIDSMQRIGAAMPSSLKETAREGLAITPTAELIKRELDKVTD
jgi:L-serine dehydratase